MRSNKKAPKQPRHKEGRMKTTHDWKEIEKKRKKEDDERKKKRSKLENSMLVLAEGDSGAIIAASVFRGAFLSIDDGASWIIIRAEVTPDYMLSIMSETDVIGTVDYRDLNIVKVNRMEAEKVQACSPATSFPKWGGAGESGVESDDVLRGK